MKHTLPWNVTGIPPEVRELARAAARREGTSVGEWLSRRIMAEAQESPGLDGPAAPLSPSRPVREEPARSGDESGLRGLRSEASEGVFRRIDEAFRNLAHRLENTERAQSDAHRAMSAAATEINAATRDQAEAFRLIATRIDRVERQTDTGPLRDAVRGLHQGLSRLAEQIAKTTSESSSGIAALTSNVEMLAGKMASAGEDLDQRSQAIEDRFAALDERIKHDEHRLKQTEERLAAALRMDETVAMLQSRMNSTEERMQQSLGRYLSGIERSLEQMGERLQKTEKRSEPDDRMVEALVSLTVRIAAMENRESTAAPEHGAGDTVTRIEAAVENAVPSGVLDMAEFRLTAAVPVVIEPAPAPEAATPTRESDAPHSHETIRDTLNREMDEAQPARPSADNYLAQARRAVRGTERSPRILRRRTDVRTDSETGMRRRVSQRVSMAFLFLLLVAAGFMVTRAIQSRANVLAFDSSNLIALAAPAFGVPPAAAGPSATAPSLSAPTGPAAAKQKTAEAGVPASTAPADSVASASILPLGTASDSPLAQLITKATAGDPKASTSLGLKYADGDGVAANDTEAFYWLQKAAEAGEPVAQYRLGTLYERGRGVPADARQALRWYEEAAKRGNRRAMHNLAVVYADGAAEDRNFPEALHWFKGAAELGLTDSQFNLAVLYERGLGVKPSLAEAYKWYEIAAAAGDSESKARLTALMAQIAPADRDAADRAAKAYKPRPIDLAANEG